MSSRLRCRTCARITPVPAVGPPTCCSDCGGELEHRQGELRALVEAQPSVGPPAPTP